MLKECYYQDQSHFGPLDYAFLHRFLDRMIQYRNSSKGSYDGKDRMEEIKSIDLARLTENTKDILLHCITKHHCEELLSLPNLKGLAGHKCRDIRFLEERKTDMKLSVEDFFKNVKRLNGQIESEIAAGGLDKNFVFEIRSIGGFAMSYWNVRENGLTEDMDSLVEINDTVRTCIRRIAQQEELPFDWINDTMRRFYDLDMDYHWTELPWFLGRKARVKVFVCSREDFLRMKIRLAEMYLSGMALQEDRDLEVDYKDTLALLRSFSIMPGVNPSFAVVRLEKMGIYRKDYPYIFAEILGEENAGDEEDYHLLKAIWKVDEGAMPMEEFEAFAARFGYTPEDIAAFYSMYLAEFPQFNRLLQARLGQCSD